MTGFPILAEALAKKGIIPINKVPKAKLKKTCIILDNGMIKSIRDIIYERKK